MFTMGIDKCACYLKTELTKASFMKYNSLFLYPLAVHGSISYSLAVLGRYVIVYLMCSKAFLMYSVVIT